MATPKVTVTGHDTLQKHIAKMQNPRLVFDADFQRIARENVRELVTSTPRKTGTTARGWTTPKKIALSNYLVDNDEKTTDGKYSIPVILDQGRRAVYPRKKFLYIPLTEAGRAKRAGAPIPEGLEFGVDYVLAKSAGQTTGTKFMTNAIKQAGRDLTSAMIATIRRVHSGG